MLSQDFSPNFWVLVQKYLPIIIWAENLFINRVAISRAVLVS